MPIRKGFTLIELLVVITIIGILTSLGTISYNKVQIKGRDTDRKNDAQTLKKGLQLYYTDKGYYPCVPTDVWCGSLWVNHATFSDQVVPKYIPKTPVDPGGNNCNYLYSVWGQNIALGVARAKVYTIFMILENTTDPDAAGAKITPVAPPPGTNNGNITFTPSAGNCPNVTYNYWVNSPS